MAQRIQAQALQTSLQRGELLGGLGTCPALGQPTGDISQIGLRVVG